MKYRVGVDIGGTFTDAVVVTQDGRMEIFKSPSTPGDSSVGVFNCLEKAAEALGCSLSDFLSKTEIFVHGTTVATNAMIQRSGAKTGLVTTEGFRDSLEMRRAHKDDIWDLWWTPPAPSVSRRLRLGVRERIDAQGEVVTPLDEEHALKVLGRLKAEGCTAIAVCTLFSFLNDAHEKRIKELAAEVLPEAYVSISSEILQQVREYERTCTTVANATVGPVLSRYVRRLETKLKDNSFTRNLMVMQSNGGVMSADYASDHAVTTLLSGPAAGAIGGVFFSRLLSMPNLIIADMGGTSFDLTLIKDGAYQLTSAGQVAGYPIAMPMIDIHTIGAGGGSIARVDEGGLLRVGPESAGADPGPACYGRGNTAPTVTDANVVLGYINPECFLGGEMKLDHFAAQSAVETNVGRPLGLGVLDAAQGIFKLVNANMADAIRVITVERGFDPREFALVACGGAAATHAARLAEQVGIKKIVVPKAASVFCALGMLESDLKHDYVRTVWQRLDNLSAAELERAYSEMESEGRYALESEGVDSQAAEYVRSADMRYVGQHHEVTVMFPDNRLTEASMSAMAQRFHDAHERLYNYSEPERPTEVINVRVSAVGRMSRATIAPAESSGSSPNHALKGSRQAYFGGSSEMQGTPCYDGETLRPGNVIQGPAVVESATTTIVVPPSFTAEVDGQGNIVMEGVR